MLNTEKITVNVTPLGHVRGKCIVKTWTAYNIDTYKGSRDLLLPGLKQNFIQKKEKIK